MNLNSDSPQPKRTAMASTKADLRELRGNSQATVKEVQAFLRELKGKSPQEMLGLVASSGLFKSLLLSTVIVAGGILLFTAIPYFMADEEAPVVNSNTETVANPSTPEPIVTSPEPAVEAKPEPADTLGIGDESSAPSNVNPLENTSDDFLKELE